MRRGSACTRSSGRTTKRLSKITSEPPLRIARISKILKPACASSRIDTAMAENESRVPTIQRTTRGILLLATG